MLYSQGVKLEALGVPSRAGPSRADPREAWRLFAVPLSPVPRHAVAAVARPCLRRGVRHRRRARAGHRRSLLRPHQGARWRRRPSAPRALFDRFNIELLATTEAPHEDLAHHAAIRASGWKGRVVTTYRPDAVIDPEHEEFRAALARFGELTGEDVASWQGYLRRAPQAPRRLPRRRRHRHRPRPSDRAHRRPRARRGGGPVRPRSSAARGPPARPSCSAPRC